MKHPVMQTVVRSACALLGTLALAQADPAQLSSAARQAQDSHFKREQPSTLLPPSLHRLLTGGITLSIDDGSAEAALGFANGGDVIALNEFEGYPVPGLPLTSVSIAWGSPLFPDPSLNGLSFTALVWSDPNGDGDPSDAVLVGAAPGVVSQEGTNTFITTSFFNMDPPLFFFVGFIIHTNAGQFPAAFDETPPSFSNRSFLAGGAHGNVYNLNENDFPVAPVENFGQVGNWLIRAEQGGSTQLPTVLWYNGDFDDINGIPNEQDSFEPGYAHVYDDFNVSPAQGWDVSSVYSNDLISTTVTGATWEIRQGITDGNGGTVVASGMTPFPTVVPTGRNGFGFTEFTVEVSVTGVHLDPGTYYLNVTPIGSLDGGRSFDSTTSGANCVGTPCGNDANSFFDSPVLFGLNFVPTSDLDATYHDFSMGVKGLISVAQPLTLENAISRKSHGAAGVFDLPLPLTGAEGIESRGGGRDSIYLTFNNNLTGVDSVVSSCGSARVALDPENAKNLIVTVQGQRCDALDITLTVNGVRDDQGNTGSATVTYGKLIGDIDGNRVVSSADGEAIRALAPAHADSSNFRDDLNLDGTINAEDVRIVRSHRGEKLP